MGKPTFFGVRHLSPGAAFHLRKKLDEVRPQLVLVEGPSDLNDQMKWLCHKETRYPVAILAYTSEAPVKTILYPFAFYSPEVQAILWAHENDVPCRFMDLPSSVFLALNEKKSLKNTQYEKENTAGTTESIYNRLELLTGEDHDTFWERCFEQSDRYMEACNAFGSELRKSDNNRPDMYENQLREAFMKKAVSDAIESGVKPEKIFCVCGAFHVDGIINTEEFTTEEVDMLPRADSTATIMPYSYYRLSSRSGYGAGNRAPAYFRLMWEYMNGEGLDGLASAYLVGLADAHRKMGNTVSSAEVIESVRLADALRQIRGSRYPCHADLKDAAVTVMGHGRYSELSIAFAEMDIGRNIGAVPEGVSRTSVQEDFYRQIKALRLEGYRSLQRQRLDLDLREKISVKSKEAAFIDLRRSFFLHRLRVLGIDFASAVPSRQEKASWGEYWDLQWSPEAEIQVVEASLMGDTIEGAAAFVLKERSDNAAGIDEAAAIFKDAFLCGMPLASAHALVALQRLAADHTSLKQTAAAAEQLSLIVRYGDIRQFDTEPVVPLLESLALRANLILFDSCRCDAKQAADVCESMEKLNVLQLNHAFLSERDWTGLIGRVSDADDLNPKCSGFAMAILLERGIADEERLGREISRRLSPGIPAELGAGWFEGLAGKNRYALIARLSLWRHLSDYLDGLDSEGFKRALVFLRRAFSAFSPSEKSDIAENLGEVWGIDPQQAAELLMWETTEAEKHMIEELEDFDFDVI